MPSNAIVLAPRYYHTPNAKTAHGLVRGSDRFAVCAVVDPDCAGEDAGRLLDGRPRGIPVLPDLDEALAQEHGIEWVVVGIATHGGRFTAELRELLLDAARRGLHIANGLHDAAGDDPEIAAAAAASGTRIVDLRRPKPKHELHFWEGAIFSVRAPRLAVLGTDCALGKRTTARMLTQALVAEDVRAEMIYTGQTGWMQGARYGFVFDSTLNDYVSGELEHAIVSCERELSPDLMLLEGQSSLRNPSGPCGAEFLLSGATQGVVLQHAPAREFFEGYEQLGLRMPALDDEIALIAHYGVPTVAVTLNGKGMSPQALERYQVEWEQRLGLPVVRVLEEGMERLVPLARAFIETHRKEATRP